jgi:hypothetical protein
MSVKNDLTVLLTQATDPTSTPEQLVKVWNSTTSSRVRKAVASNPNCDTATLCMASRLYIREVVENPSFEIRNLFSEDPIVSDIYNAYTDPQAFWEKGIGRTKAKGPVYRAMLTSPNLKSWKVVEELVRVLSSAEFVRELRDVDVKARIRRIVKSSVDSFDISALVFFRSNSVITLPELSATLGSRRPGEFNLPRKAYCETFRIVRDNTDYPTLLKFVLASSNYSLRHLIKSSDLKEYLYTDQCLTDLANLYKDVLVYEVAAQKQHYGKNSSWYWSKMSYNDSKQSHFLAKLIWEGITYRNDLSLAGLDLTRLFADLQMVGFDQDYGPYKCPIKFKELGLLTGRNDMCQKLLDLQDDLAFEFFMTCGVLWREWYAKDGPGNLESQVMDRMHRINESRAGLYYRYSSLSGYYPSVEISNQNGLSYKPEPYHDLKWATGPTGSGLVAM